HPSPSRRPVKNTRSSRKPAPTSQMPGQPQTPSHRDPDALPHKGASESHRDEAFRSPPPTRHITRPGGRSPPGRYTPARTYATPAHQPKSSHTQIRAFAQTHTPRAI